MLSKKAKRNLSRIIPFGIIWFLFGLIFFVVEKAAMSGLDQQAPGGIEIGFEIFIFGTLANAAVGLFVGVIEVLFVDQAFAHKSFAKKILYKTALYSLLMFFIILISFPIAASIELNTNVLDERVLRKLSAFLTSPAHLSTDLQITVQLLASLFYAEISENIGHGILINFFTGKYHTPTKENRIFMFSDMKSSTSIAEKIGHENYFRLLRAYYNDLSDSIIEYSGEIYQYIGDEIVVSWNVEDGLVNNNCIKCFFAMKNDLGKRADWYNEHFGITPTFKAGIHIGDVTTGEIGSLKKEIIFTGDVLNSTARIQGLCNQYMVDLLVSKKLLNHLSLSSEYQIRPIGKKELRGKTEYIELYTLHMETGLDRT